MNIKCWWQSLAEGTKDTCINSYIGVNIVVVLLIIALVVPNPDIPWEYALIALIAGLLSPLIGAIILGVLCLLLWILACGGEDMGSRDLTRPTYKNNRRDDNNSFLDDWD